MAFVDQTRNRLILKVVLTGPPAVGKTERIVQLRTVGSGKTFGSKTRGYTEMAMLELDIENSRRPVEVEVYEWHGPERSDLRDSALFTGLDGVVFIADAREDRLVDTRGAFKWLNETAGKTRIVRLPSIMILSRQDEGLLRLPLISKELQGPTWSQLLDISHDAAEPFVEAVRMLGELMVARAL
ncbi:MAG: hypothetical protein HYV07_05040 [Deltaproteobacteria bacterium]|nr:hypothetical protein [Deltaproteobacteria bacterium]